MTNVHQKVILTVSTRHFLLEVLHCSTDTLQLKGQPYSAANSIWQEPWLLCLRPLLELHNATEHLHAHHLRWANIIHTHIHTHTHTHTYNHVHTHTHTHTHPLPISLTHTHTQIHTMTLTDVRISLHIYTVENWLINDYDCKLKATSRCELHHILHHLSCSEASTSVYQPHS